MLDVHPPHESVHTWRDFFIHVATICVGLLIAVGLEQTVEYFHHCHQVHVARERVRDEVAVNRRILHEDEHALQRTEADLDHALALVRNRRSHASGPSDVPDFTFRLQGFYDDAYENARTSGVLNLMPYDESAMYSDAYTANAICVKAGLDLWQQLYSAKAAMHGRPFSQLDTEELLPLITAISEARGKAELEGQCFVIQEQEWDALLSGHFRNDIGPK